LRASPRLGIFVERLGQAQQFTPLTSGSELFGGLFLLLRFDEFEYLALFLWLAIAGAGAVSLDHLLTKMTRRPAHA
jgi:hypothetical protein